MKYRSGLSSYASDDGIITHQLAKEWLQLCRRAGEAYVPWLIFLTIDIAVPAQDIEDAKNEIKAKLLAHEIHSIPNISWLSWRRLGDLFKSQSKMSTSPALNDVSQLIRLLGLTYFDGFSGHEELYEINYKFKKSVIKYNWKFSDVPQSKWRFT